MLHADISCKVRPCARVEGLVIRVWARSCVERTQPSFFMCVAGVQPAGGVGGATVH
jgi:hypothetical protein